MGFFTDAGFGRGELLVTQWPQWQRRTPSWKAGESVRLQHKVFMDVDPSMTRGHKQYSNEQVKCVAVKNTTDSPFAVGSEQSIDGYTGRVDEYLQKPVKPTEIFWLVIDGLVTTDFEAGTRVRVAGGPDGTLLPSDPETTIGIVSITGPATGTADGSVELTAATDGDAGGLTYTWSIDPDTNASIENGNNSTVKINFGAGASGAYEAKCVVGTTDPNATDGPTQEATKTVTVS